MSAEKDNNNESGCFHELNNNVPINNETEDDWLDAIFDDDDAFFSGSLFSGDWD